MIKYNTDRKGVTKGSIKKIWNLINIENRPLTPSGIANNVNLHFQSVKSCLKLLEELNLINIFSTGRTWIIIKKQKEIKNDI